MGNNLNKNRMTDKLSPSLSSSSGDEGGEKEKEKEKESEIDLTVNTNAANDARLEHQGLLRHTEEPDDSNNTESDWTTQELAKLLHEKLRQEHDQRPEHFCNELSDFASQVDLELQAALEPPDDNDNNNNNNIKPSALDSQISRREAMSAFQRVSSKLSQLQEEGSERLPPDTFSYFMVLPLWSAPLLFAVVTLTIQVLTLVLVLVDKIGTSEKDYNPLNLPVNVDWAVRISQIVALLVIVVTQDDTIVALSQISDGYHPEIVSVFPNASFIKWVGCVSCRLLVGLLILFVAFMLVVQEESVIDIFLNFLAVSFVSEVDNLAQRLALRGFAGMAVERLAYQVQYTTFPSTARVRRRTQSIWHRHARWYLMTVVLALLLATWGWVVNRQRSEYFVTRDLYVQFSDDFRPEVATFSGIYSLGPQSWDGRATYVEQRSGRARIGYCRDLTAWTFSYTSNPDDKGDPCQALVKSAPTETYDVMKSASLPWYNVDLDKGDILMRSFFMRSSDCRDNNVCGIHGSCLKDGGCLCENGWFGLRCEFPLPCTNIELDELKSEFLGTRQWSRQFETLKHVDGTTVQVYHRPVYVQQSLVDSVLDIILFSGRRWIVTHSGSLQDFQPVLGNSSIDLSSQLSSYLEQEFHAYWSNYTVAFVSEPVDAATPKDAATPVSLKWFRSDASASKRASGAVADETQDLEAVLICANCNNMTNPCFFQSLCNPEGVCECTTGASGTLCQLAPVSNGRCNPFFNNPEFQYDGGDCCQATCVNSDDFFCGTSVIGFDKKLTAFVGYGECKDPLQTCDSCWKPSLSTSLRSQDTEHTYHSFFHSNQWMDISKDGLTLIVHEGVQTQGFQAYNIETSQWKRKGRILSDRFGQGYIGDAVSLSKNGLVVAVAGSDTVQAYSWDATGWIEQGQRIVRNEPDEDLDIGMSVQLSSNGNVLAAGFISPGDVVVYDIVRSTEDDVSSNFLGVNWVQRGASVISSGGTSNVWYSLSLSGDGSTIAIGTRVELERSPSPFDLTIDTEDVVQVFRWNDTSWDQLGSDIFVPGLFFACYGCALSLSSNAKILAVGSSEDDSNMLFGGSVRCYEWNATSWNPKGSTIFGTKDDYKFGKSVALSDDGLVLAVGSEATAEKSTSTLNIFRWEESRKEWILSDTLVVGKTSTAAFARDATILAVSSMVDEREDIIETNILQFQAPPMQCKNDESLLRFSLLTDAKASEILWRFEDSEGNTLFEQDETFDDGRTSTEIHEWCIQKNSCVTLKLFDFGGNGLCCSNGEGAYAVWLDGVEIASTGEFHWYEEVRLGNCTSACEDGTSLFRLELMLDDQGSETVWAVRNSTNQTVLEEGGIYPNDVNGIVVREACYSPDECHIFRLEDKCPEGFLGNLIGDPECGLGFDTDDVPASGYRITFGGLEIGNSQDFVLSRDHPIGDCPARCPDGMSLLRILIRTDTRGDETTWNVVTEDGQILVEGGPYDAFATIPDEGSLCIDPVNECTIVTVFDSSGNGMTGNIWGVGGYVLELDGESIKFGATFGSKDTTRIGDNCAPTTSPTTFPTWSPSSSPPTTSLIIEPSQEPPTASPIKEPLQGSPTASPIIEPSQGPTVNSSDGPETTPCANGSALLEIEIRLDIYSFETTWELSDGANNILLQGGPYSSSGTLSQDVCVAPGDCYTLTVYDSAADGILFGYATMTLVEQSAFLSGFGFTDVGIISVGQCD